jgi:hypothetical protein
MIATISLICEQARHDMSCDRESNERSIAHVKRPSVGFFVVD